MATPKGVPKKEPIRAYREGDEMIVPVRLDGDSNSLLTIDHMRNLLRNGAAFMATIQAAVVATTGTLQLLLVTPNTDKFIHLTYDIAVEGETAIVLYEAPTATAGDAVTAYNRNRNSAVAAGLVVTSTPTEVTPGSTILRKHNLLAGGAYKSQGEIILKKNTKYLLSLANSTGAVNIMAVNLDWVEYTAIV